MKKETTTTQQTVNSLKHSIVTTDINGNPMNIEIRLSDDCHNGHNDFAITADLWQKGMPKADRYHIMGGCCHDEIIAAIPKLKIFVDLHLSDVNGAPMYAIENGYYHLMNSPIETSANYLRITKQEANSLYNTSADKDVFIFNILQMGLPKIWKEQANKAIKILEKMTGQTFEDNSTKLQSIELTQKKILEITKKINKGFYSVKNVKNSRQAEIKKQRQEIAKKLKSDMYNAIKVEKNEYNVLLSVHNAKMSLDCK